MRGGGCFAPEGLVEIVRDGGTPAEQGAAEAEEGAAGDDVLVPVEQVRAGDVVRTADGSAARVVCVVLTETDSGTATFSQLPGGLQLTEWHPIIDAASGRWRFPIMVGQRVSRRCGYVHNFVLEHTHIVRINGVGCATLGHGIDEDVVRHPYWGCDVMSDLRAHPGWAEGRVVLESSRKLRASRVL